MPPTWTDSLMLGIQLFILVAVLLVFLDTWHRRRGTKSEGWRRINAGIVGVLLIAIGSTIGQMFLSARTELECRILHHIAGTMWNTCVPFVRILFIARLIEINKLPREWERNVDYGLLVTAFVLWIVAVVLLNMSIRAAVIDDICIAVLDPAVTAYTIVSPAVIDIATNVRLWLVHMQALQRNAFRLLITTTFAFCLASCVLSLFSVLIILCAIPLDPAFYTVWLTFQQAFDACSIALPSVIVRFARGQGQLHKTNPMVVHHAAQLAAMPSLKPFQFGTSR
ncbi:G-protein coupled receptors family 1 profile domain-containing protein [Plasmodiophora brassicae]|uniref:Uncharacterized protein n=1 Tax=Plasmodiophora brassicae TaxID=37360 RepID=A0A0G4IZS5_PLABS|nr:hypothetical protein PBRA_001625 [Plasmodiophora brassicae]SPQ93935.1 unnamed protein product [Plasmodiophora brassicae]